MGIDVGTGGSITVRRVSDITGFCLPTGAGLHLQVHHDVADGRALRARVVHAHDTIDDEIAAGGRPLGSGNAPGTVEALVSTAPVLVSVQEVLPLCERAALAFTTVTAACPPLVPA